MIRASTFSDKWPIVNLGEVVEFLDHRRVPITASDRTPGPYQYYGANGSQGTIDDYIFDEPLVLVAEDGGNFGNPDRTIAYIATGKYWVNNHAHVLRPKKGLDLTYLCRVLEKYDVTPYIKGATRAKLSKTDASRIPIPLPPLETQKKIAAILEKADQLRKDCQQMEQELNNLAQSVFMDMFGDPVSNPKGWEVLPLKSLVLEFKYGSSEKASGEGLPILRIPNIVGDQISLDDLKYISLAAEERDRLLLEHGDMLFVRTNGNRDYIGRSCVFDLDGDYVYASYLIRARVNQERVNPFFLNELFKLKGGRKLITSNAKTTAGQFNLNTQGLGATRVIVPPLELQIEYIRKLVILRGRVQELKSQKVEFEELFSGLMQKAFSGELTIKDRAA